MYFIIKDLVIQVMWMKKSKFCFMQLLNYLFTLLESQFEHIALQLELMLIYSLFKNTLLSKHNLKIHMQGKKKIESPFNILLL